MLIGLVSSFDTTDSTYKLIKYVLIKAFWGFPGGLADKNPPANAGDMGSIPDPGRSHMLRSS